VKHLTHRARHPAEVPHGEALTHHRHSGFRPELVGRDQPARDGPQLKDVCESCINAKRRNELGLTAGLHR
jgi:hypothetical protein